MTSLGELEGGAVKSAALAISADGRFIVGTSASADGNEGVVWIDGMIHGVGDLSGGAHDSQLVDVSDDGSIAVGFGTNAIGMEALICLASMDYYPISLNDLLEVTGVDTDGCYLQAAISVSADGTTIVGFGLTANGDMIGFRLRILDAWAGYPILNGFVDTTPFMGWLNIQALPWVWCLGTNCWYFLHESVAEAGRGWVYTMNFPSMAVYPMPGTNWGWSFGLSKWVYLSTATVQAGQGWVYLM